MKNRFWLITLQTVIAIAILFEVGFLGDAVSDGMTSQADVKHACSSKTSDDPSYMVSVERVTSLQIFKDWKASLDSNSRIALGWDNKTEFVRGHCYWSISFYKNDSKQMQLWKAFQVGITSNDIYMMDDEGNYLPLVPSSTLLK